MNIVDILLILALAGVLFFAVRRTVRTRRSGGCGCGCDGCGARCGAKAKK